MYSIKGYNLIKKYKNKNIVEDILFSIEEEKIYIVQGKEKTVLFELINNKMSLNGGGILVNDEYVHKNQKVIKNIYYCSQDMLYPDNMKCKAVFKWTKEFYEDFDLDLANVLSEQYNLNINKKIINMNFEEEQILKIVVALSSNAKVLIFDEPLIAIDKEKAMLFLEELNKIYSSNKNTIILGIEDFCEYNEVLKEVRILNIHEEENEREKVKT